MNDLQKKLADEMIIHFKNINGRHLNARELVGPLRSDEKEIRYVAAMLVNGGVLNKTEPLVKSSTDIVPESYFLTDKGWAYSEYDKLQEDEGRKELLQQRLTQSIIDTNASVQETNISIKDVNESTRKLNEEILPGTFETQRKQGKSSIRIASVTLLFIGMTAYFQYKDQTANRIEDLQEQIRLSKQSLDSINSSFKGIKLAVEKIANDTTK